MKSKCDFFSRLDVLLRGNDVPWISVLLIVSLSVSVFFGHSFPVTSDGLGAIFRGYDFFRVFMDGSIDMRKPYIGVDLYLPFMFIITGPTRIAFQTSQTIFLAFTGVLLFLAGKNIFDRKTGFLASLLVSFSPLIMMLRWNEQPFLTFTLTFVLFCLVKYYKNKRPLFLYIGMFFLGIGIYIKLISVYFILALLLSYCVLYKRGRKHRLHVSGREAMIAFFSLLIGMSPLLGYNIQEGGQTFGVVAATFQRLDLVHILRYTTDRIYQLPLAVQGVSTSYPVQDLFSYVIPLNAIMFIFAFALVFYKKDRRDIFILLIILFFTLLSIVVPPPSAPNVLHLYHIVPLAFLLIARVVVSIRKRELAFVLVALMILLNLQTMFMAKAKLEDEQWIEQNFPRAAKVHGQISEFVESGDTVIVPPINILDRNVFYLSINENVTRKMVCDGTDLRTDVPATCNISQIKEIIDNHSGRLLFAMIPPERSSYFLYEENCATNQSVCSLPFFAVERSVTLLSRHMEIIGQVNDTKGQVAYNIYLIR